MKQNLINEIDSEVKKFINSHIELSASSTKVLITTTAFNVINLEEDHQFTSIVNLKRINDIRFVNKFQEAVNEKLPIGGIYIGLVETMEQRTDRLMNKYLPGISHVYTFLDFQFKRVLPKIPFFKKLYFFVTNGRNRVISKAESLGRLVCCGFKIIEIRNIGNQMYFVGKKVQEPHYDLNPSYGPLFAMNRVGKDGKIFKVYKFRTMYPYAEYLQEYIYEQNKLDQGGKFANDFRVTKWGAFMRKCWIDELPMLINLFRGELKLVGVRPISRHYFSLYTKELQEKRINAKPGLLPPFYSDMPKTLEEIVDSELKYLHSYKKNPFSTDFRYFVSILNNIVFRKSRSK
jgi:lipopolysaccharide/colanic/teichoic acid biosynthesis glycosyltransferase